MINQDLLDAIAIVSFVVGIANYNENLSQSDKDDMMQALDKKTSALLKKLEDDIEEQNRMLTYIIDLLEDK